MRVFRVFHPLALGLFLACHHVSAVPLEQAQINRIVSDVRVVDPRAGAHAATMHEVIKEDLGVLTGIRSRSELLFQDLTLTRLGAETFFSFKPGTRDMTLDRGAFLLHVPKGRGGARIHAAGITAAITGTTIMIELMPGRWLKVIVLEGSLRLSNNRRLGEAVRLTAGKMVIMKPDATRIPDPVDIDLATLVRTSALTDPTVFKPLPSLALIDREIAAQARLKDKKQLVDTNLVIFGSGTQVVAASPTILNAIDPKKQDGTLNTPLFAALTKATQPIPPGGILDRVDTTQTLARATTLQPINTALATLATTPTTTATPTLATLASTARTSAAALSGGVSTTTSQLTNGATQTLQGATGTLLTSGTQLSSGSLAIVGATSGNLLTSATNLTGTTLGGLTNIGSGTVGNIIDTTGTLLGGTTNTVGSTVGNVIETTGTLLGSTTNTVGSTVGNVIDTAGTLLGAGGSTTNGGSTDLGGATVSTTIDATTNTVSGITTTISGSPSNPVDPITTIVGSTTNVVGGSTAPNVIDSTGGTVLGDATTNVGGNPGTITPIVDSSTNLIGTGTTGTGGTSDSAASSGSNVVDTTTNLPGGTTSLVSAPADSTTPTATTTTTPVEIVTATTLPVTAPMVSNPTPISAAPSPAPTPAPAPAPSFNVTDSGQLASLLSSTAPTTSGSIQYSSVGDNIVVNGQTLDAGRTGTVDIRHSGAGGIIALTNATLKGDVVKVGTLGPNGQLIIGGGVIDANSAIKLYAAGSNGEVRFVDDVTLKGPSVKTIAGSTVTINNGKVVTIGGLRPVDVFTDRANYSGSGGNGSTTGRFGGAGARTKPFSQAPSF